jgi:biotin synthase
MSDETQALCFLAGANSIFYGEKLLTTGNPDVERDRKLFARLGLKPEQRPAQAAAADAHTAVHAGVVSRALGT